MAEQVTAPTPSKGHGGLHLPSVIVDSYNLELEDDEGFLGDRVKQNSFREFSELDLVTRDSPTETTADK